MGNVIDGIFEIVFIIKSSLSTFDMLFILFILIAAFVTLILCQVQSDEAPASSPYSRSKHTMVPPHRYEQYIRENTLREVGKLKENP